MEFLSEKYQKEITINKRAIGRLEKLSRKISWAMFKPIWEKDYREMKWKVKDKISSIHHENYMLKYELPYHEWAKTLSDEELVDTYINNSEKKLSRENTNSIKELNEYIGRQNSIYNEIAIRTSKGFREIKLGDPVKGAINSVIASIHSYEGPFKRYEEYLNKKN